MGREVVADEVCGDIACVYVEDSTDGTRKMLVEKRWFGPCAEDAFLDAQNFRADLSPSKGAGTSSPASGGGTRSRGGGERHCCCEELEICWKNSLCPLPFIYDEIWETIGRRQGMRFPDEEGNSDACPCVALFACNFTFLKWSFFGTPIVGKRGQ